MNSFVGLGLGYGQGGAQGMNFNNKMLTLTLVPGLEFCPRSHNSAGDIIRTGI